MPAEWFAVFVEKPRVGRLQRPAELPAVTLADVNLVALRVNFQKQPFLIGRLKLLRDILRGSRQRKPRAQSGEQHCQCQSSNAVVHAHSDSSSKGTIRAPIAL